MSDHDEFMRGFCESSSLELVAAERAYQEWLQREGYSEIYRIDLEGGGYEAGLEIGEDWRNNR